MSEVTFSELQTELAAEFDRQGWEYDLSFAPSLATAACRSGTVVAESLAALAPPEFLHHNQTDRQNLAAAIERVAGGLTVISDNPPTSIAVKVEGDIYTLKFGDKAHLENVNIGPGNQLSIDSGSSNDDLLTAIGVLITSGLNDDWDDIAARAVGTAVEEQGNLTVDEVREAVIEAGKDTGVKPSKVKELTEKVAVSGVGGFMATALTSGLGDLAHFLS
jgi:hypothetical protein